MGAFSVIGSSMSTTEAPVAVDDRRAVRGQLRIVIADDDRDTADMLALVLRDAGHVVYTVYSGGEVLQTISTIRPDAIILDVNLPKISGFALAQATRYSFSNMRRPLLIAISGVWTETPDRLIARQLGFDHYLVKPADPALVLNLLEPLPRAPKLAL